MWWVCGCGGWWLWWWPLVQVAEALQACDDGGATLSVSFFEIYCSKVYDLLQGRAEKRTLEDAHGEVQVAGLAEAAVTDLDSALAMIELGQQARVTHANAVHAGQCSAVRRPPSKGTEGTS